MKVQKFTKEQPSTKRKNSKTSRIEKKYFNKRRCPNVHSPQK